MIRVLMKFGSRCKTIFSLFQAGFVHRYGSRTGSGYAETAMITVGVKFDLLICICTHMKSVNCYHHIYSKNSCVVVFESVKCVALPGLSPSYEQSNCWCLAGGVRGGVDVQHLNRIYIFLCLIPEHN